MQRISVVLPQPDGPSRPVMVPRAMLHRKVVQRRALTPDDPQMIDVDRGSDATVGLIHHCDEVIMR